MFLVLMIPATSFCQTTISESARRGIAAGNNAWIDGMKRANATVIAASYAGDAVDCNPTGECVQGRAAIARQLRDRVQKLGPAKSASVTSKGSVQQGDFVYEWGEAEASFPNGARVAGNYLTVWRKSGDRWLIFRNIKIPSDAGK
jgi:ketosteroid isomerase-like protein